MLYPPRIPDSRSGKIRNSVWVGRVRLTSWTGWQVFAVKLRVGQGQTQAWYFDPRLLLQGPNGEFQKSISLNFASMVLFTGSIHTMNTRRGTSGSMSPNKLKRSLSVSKGTTQSQQTGRTQGEYASLRIDVLSLINLGLYA